LAGLALAWSAPQAAEDPMTMTSGTFGLRRSGGWLRFGHCRMIAPCIALLDNGSLRPAAVLSLRAVAAALAARMGVKIAPVSLLHSHKVPAGDLDGQPAVILEPWLKCEAEAGTRNFLLVPFSSVPAGRWPTMCQRGSRN